MFNQRDVIPTDIPIINAAFSGSINGGIHSGLILAAGPSKSYKTLLSLVCVKAYLNKYDDAVAIILDSEGGVTPEYLKQHGISPERVIHVPIENLEALKFEMVHQLKEINRGDHVIFVIDSIGNTASVKEIEDAMNEKTVGDFTRAKSTKALFRMVTPSLVAKDIPCIAICHTYEEIGAMYAKTIISGGCLEAGTLIQMSNGTNKKVEEISVGELVKTLDGDKEVTYTWNPDTLENGTPECYRVTFEDGTSVVCSAPHKFMIDGKWVEAEKLHAGDEVDIL
jgi:RecA/RadA recombinase